MARSNLPLPCCAFNWDGTILAYAASYDWTKGSEGYNPATMGNYLLLHASQDTEVKGRTRTQQATPKR